MFSFVFIYFYLSFLARGLDGLQKILEQLFFSIRKSPFFLFFFIQLEENMFNDTPIIQEKISEMVCFFF